MRIAFAYGRLDTACLELQRAFPRRVWSTSDRLRLECVPGTLALRVGRHVRVDDRMARRNIETLNSEAQLRRRKDGP